MEKMEQPKQEIYDFCPHCGGVVRKGVYHESDKYYHYYFCEVQLKPNEKHRFAIKTKYTLDTEKLKADVKLVGATSATTAAAVIIVSKKKEKGTEVLTSKEELSQADNLPDETVSLAKEKLSSGLMSTEPQSTHLEIVKDPSSIKNLFESLADTILDIGDAIT